jgi:hypothetical protein
MPSAPTPKIGIIACSGEELPEGTVTRLATLRVLHELRRPQTVTICLPLFLAGGEEDRTFARFHPTITVDGCDLRCAARGTEMYSGKPAASIVVSELVAESGLAKPEGRRRLNEAGRRAVVLVAERLAELVDQVLAKDPRVAERAAADAAAAPVGEGVVTCSCGSGIPVLNVVIEGKTVELVALPLIFRQLREAGRTADAKVAIDLMQQVKIYNAVPPGAEAGYRQAVLREYALYCQREALR